MLRPNPKSLDEEQQLKVGSSSPSTNKIMRSRPLLPIVRQRSLVAEEPVRDKNPQPVRQEHPDQQRQASPRLFRIRLSCSSSSLADIDPSFTVSIHDEQATPYTMFTDENPFLSKSEEYNEVKAEERQEEDDDVSSISNDSARRFNINHGAVGVSARPLGPPAVIVVRNIRPTSRSATPPMIQHSRDSKSSVAIIVPSQSTDVVEARHQQKQSPAASVKTAPSWPPRVVTTNSVSSPMMATRPIAPRHSASSTAFSHVYSPRTPVMSAASPMRRPSDNVCGSSIKNGPVLSRVNTDNTVPLTPTSVDQSRNSSTSAFNHRSAKQIRKPKIITQRRATTGAVDMIPSASFPLIIGSRHHQEPRQHEHEYDTGSVQPGPRLSNSADQCLLGDRNRRKDIRGTQSVFSFGSLVGQSSSVLTHTTITTDIHQERQSIGSPSREFSQMIKANRKFEKVCGAETFAAPRLTSDMQLFWQRCVGQPVRRVTGTENDSAARLCRSSTGCLA